MKKSKEKPISKNDANFRRSFFFILIGLFVSLSALAQKITVTEQLSYALEDLLDQNNILFQSETENLSAYQMNFLKAIVDGIHTKFSSKEVISKYNLGTSANIVRLKNALLQKELIETNGKEIVLADPVFGVWFKKEMLY
jgi:hypothetical protein